MAATFAAAQGVGAGRRMAEVLVRPVLAMSGLLGCWAKAAPPLMVRAAVATSVGEEIHLGVEEEEALASPSDPARLTSRAIRVETAMSPSLRYHQHRHKLVRCRFFLLFVCSSVI